MNWCRIFSINSILFVEGSQQAQNGQSGPVRKLSMRQFRMIHQAMGGRCWQVTSGAVPSQKTNISCLEIIRKKNALPGLPCFFHPKVIVFVGLPTSILVVSRPVLSSLFLGVFIQPTYKSFRGVPLFGRPEAKALKSDWTHSRPAMAPPPRNILRQRNSSRIWESCTWEVPVFPEGK